MKNVVIVGSSGHAKVVADILEKQGTYRLVGFLDDRRSVGETTLRYPILGSTNEITHIASECDLWGCLVGIGDNAVRAQVVRRLLEAWPECQFATAIHPSASIATDVVIEEGSVVMAGVAVNISSRVGPHCILNTLSSLDHDSIMEEFSSLAPRAATGGNCRIGSHTAVSIGAVLKHGISIGSDTVIGAGSVVLSDMPAGSICYGVPAKQIRTRSRGDRYL